MLAACGSDSKKDDGGGSAAEKRHLLPLGDGMGLTTMTAARIYWWAKKAR
jgi:alkaline phosphatase